jgi:RNA polymerase sigma-70 factor, ECF subfamily
MPVVQRPSGEVYPAEAWSAQASTDLGLVRALRAGNEPAFVSLVEDHQAALLRLAMIYVKTSSIAEEVVQETWLGVLRGLEDFEGRASLKT